MKRYRIFTKDSDSRPRIIKFFNGKEVLTPLESKIFEPALHSFKYQFGEENIDEKLKNFYDIDNKPFSIVAYHNIFLEQIRNSFIIGSYYPSLVASCTLGERILNHLILNLRDDFKSTSEYRQVYRKSSFDNWEKATDILVAWGILLESTANYFYELKRKRNNAIHFNLDTEDDERQQALDSISLIQNIINVQFSAFGKCPWIIRAPGVSFIKKDWENHPFIKLVYLPNCVQVGPNHIVKRVFPLEIVDDFPYDKTELTDEEFIDIYTSMRIEKSQT